MSKTAHLPRSTTWPTSVTIDGWEKSFTPRNCKTFLNSKSTAYINDVISWPHPDISIYLKSLDKIDTLDQWNVPIGPDVTLYRHIMRLKYTLEWWEQLPTTKHLNSKGIIYQNLTQGPQFADDLDDAIKYGMRLGASLALSYGKEEYPDFCIDFEDQDQYFSPQHLIPFERPESDDILLVLQDKGPINEILELELRELIQEFIHTPIECKRELDDVDRLKFLGSATSFDPTKNGRIPKIEAELKNSTLPLTKQFTYDYVNVYKKPHESRACVVPTKETLHTITLLELQMEQVISCPWDAIREKDFSYLPEYLSFYSKNIYIMSDQKKCGLTFPRRLLVILYEELAKTFPTFDFDLAEGLLDSWIKINGSMHKMRGGPGLGQFNKSISLLVSLLFESWRRKQDPNLHLKGKFYNDDQVIKFSYLDVRKEPLPDWVTDLALSWDMYMESYGLTIHKKKPFVAASGVFLEVYGDGFPVTSIKTTQKVGNVFHTLCSPNIAIAKELFCSIYNNLEQNHQIIAKNLLFNIIAPLWGYEFYPQEIYLPYQFGGWVNFMTEEGLDNLFNHIDQIPLQYRGLMNLLDLNIKPSGKSKIPSINSRISHIKDQFNQFDLLPIPSIEYYTLVKNALSSFRETKKQRFKRFQKLLKRRQDLFHKKEPNIREFTNKYWYFTFEQGKAFAPPLFATLNDNTLPLGEPLIEGIRPQINTDPIRAISRIRQEQSEMYKYNTFWTPYKTQNINSLFYMLIHSLNISHVPITGQTINYSLILGEEKLNKIINFSLRTYGSAYIPKVPIDLLSLLNLSSQSYDDNIIFVDHNSQFVCISNWKESFLPEKGQVEADIVNQINSYLSTYKEGILPIGPFSSITELEEILPSQCVSIDINSHIENHPNSDIPISEEENDALKYLLYQIAAPEHQAVVEDVIRNDLEYQIYGIQDNEADVLSDEEGLLDMFG